MKIALIEPRASYFIAGSERVSIKHAELLSKLGHEVELYTSLRAKKEETFFFKELGDKKIKTLSILKFDITQILPEIYKTEPDTEHVRWVMESLAFSQKIYDTLENNKPDIILSYYLPDSLFKPVGIPNSIYLLGNPSKDIPLYKAFIQFCDATIAISSIVEEKWKDRTSKINLNYKLGTGVDYPILQTSTINSRTKYNLVFAGRLITRKGILTLIDAFNEIIKKNNDICLWILGDGELKNIIEEKIKLLKLDANVRLVGLVNNPYDYFTMADVCIFPSHQGDGLMGTVLEAMSAGKPVITTIKNGNEDVITNNLNGILIRPENTEDIIKSVHDLLDNTEKRNIIGKNAQKYIKENMTWSLHSKRLLKILEEIRMNYLAASRRGTSASVRE